MIAWTTALVIGMGAVVFVFALLVGLDFAFVWALLAFLLNYVPTIGSVIAVIPPSLFALVQFDNPTRALLVFFGMAAVQLICGNYVDPLLQGRFLKLSPVAVRSPATASTEARLDRTARSASSSCARGQPK